MFKREVDRRRFLRAAGVAVSLPVLESLGMGQELTQKPEATRQRLVAINVGLGLHAPNIIPQQAGRDYELPPYLKVLENNEDLNE